MGLGLFLALVTAESAVRALDLAPPPRGENKALRIVCRNTGDEEAPGVGRKLVPSTEERHAYHAQDGGVAREVLYRINGIGLRGPEASPTKAPGTLRICALGDSFTFGTAINYEETWPAALERELTGATQDDVEVLNCGIEAINLPQEIALLENRVARLQPDIVILCVYINDASGRGIESAPLSASAVRRRDWIDRLGLTSGVWAEGEELDAAQERMMSLRRMSELVDWLANRAYLALYGPICRENYHRDWSPGSPGWAAAERAITRAKELSLLADFELIVTMYPVLTGLEDEYPYAREHERVGEICEHLGVPFVDLAPPLAELLDGRSSCDLHAHAHDAHPNGEANERVAEVLADAVRALGR